MPLTRNEARKIALAWPGATEGPYFGKPSVFVGEKFLTRVHHKEEAMVFDIGSMEMRDMMLEAEPKLFYITEHYRKFPYLLARLSALNKTVLTELLNARALRIAATGPKRKWAKTKTRKKVKP